MDKVRLTWRHLWRVLLGLLVLPAALYLILFTYGFASNFFEIGKTVDIYEPCPIFGGLISLRTGETTTYTIDMAFKTAWSMTFGLGGILYVAFSHVILAVIKEIRKGWKVNITE